MPHEYGDLDTEVIFQTKYARTESGYTITIIKHCKWENRDTYTPAINSAHPTQTAYSLKDAQQEQLPGGVAQITLTYVAINDTLPETTYEEQGNMIEVDIREHPDFDSWAAEWDNENDKFLPTSDKYGTTSYIKGTLTVTKTSYSSSRPAFSSYKDDIGQKEAPGGDYGAAAHWLVLDKHRMPVGNYWATVTVYQYSPVAYNTDIYPDPS